jgi:hypothetical protein
MKTKTYQTAVFTLLTFLSLTCFGMPKDSTHKYFSFGLRANTFTNGDLIKRMMPASRLILNVNPIPYLRLELQYGAIKNAEDLTNGSGGVYTLKSSATDFGAGIFGMYKRQSTSFYLGTRYAITNYTMDQLKYDAVNPNGSVSVIAHPGKTTTTSLVLGGEHFFGRYFSFGGEISLSSYADSYLEGAASIEVNKVSTFTETALILRFYPF